MLILMIVAGENVATNTKKIARLVGFFARIGLESFAVFSISHFWGIKHFPNCNVSNFGPADIE